MNRTGIVAVVLFAACAAASAWQRQGHGQSTAPPEDGWRTFEGSWSATGSRHVLPTEGHGRAAILQLSGAIVLTSGNGLGRGFRGEAIGFDDGRSLSVGRAVWTDDRGDRIYSALKGEPVQTGRRVLGTITGGTGRYAGLTGDYVFTWQYVVGGEESQIQGRAVGLGGRFRLGEVSP